MRILRLAFLVFCLLLFASITFGDSYKIIGTLTAKKVSTLPVLDGQVDAVWEQAQPLTIDLSPIAESYAKVNPNWKKLKSTGPLQATIRALHNGKEICLLAEWEDTTKDDKHLMYVWDKAEKIYKDDTDSRLEDRLAYTFGMTDNFCGCMIVHEDSSQDVWHWKAYRTNTNGFFDDKRHLSSQTKTLRATKVVAPDGGVSWLKRPRDKGTPPYKSVDPFEYIGDRIPAYTMQIPEGSAADVRGKGSWKNNSWTLEARRKLDTGNPDDVVFAQSNATKMSVAIFNNTAAQQHSVSGVIELVLE